MLYTHKFQIKAPLDAVARFHADSSSMGSITPPPVIVRVHSAPGQLGEGDQMDFTLWVILLPLHWVARIQDVSPRGFTDVQLSGPFQSWQHRHEFCPISETTTEVRDTVQATISRNPFKWLVGLGMWASLPMLFAYRGWKTRRLLEHRHAG